jgi:hypothetical protein
VWWYWQKGWEGANQDSKLGRWGTGASKEDSALVFGSDSVGIEHGSSAAMIKELTNVDEGYGGQSWKDVI